MSDVLPDIGEPSAADRIVEISLISDALGDLSGAHINPAVTVAFALARRLPARQVPVYLSGQLAGALAASALLRVTFLSHETLGATVPAIPAAGAFAFELLLTFMLMFVIVHVASGAKEKGLLAGVAIGGTVAMGAIFAGPVTGGSMNPARSFGPALVYKLTGGEAGAQAFQLHWCYWAAPIAGAVVAALVYDNLLLNDSE